ncbi:PX domain-containing protein ypt35, partial [Coniochaeta pulveracea]
MASAVAETNHPTPAKDGPNSGASDEEPSTSVPAVTTNPEATSASATTLDKPTSQPNGHVALDAVLSNGNNNATDSDAGVETDSFDNSATSSALSPVISPPYWRINYGNSAPGSDNQPRPPNGHSRTESVESVLPVGAITLQDNESSVLQARDRNAACWAKSVEITNYIIVNGSATNFGAFVVWNIKVETLS